MRLLSFYRTVKKRQLLNRLRNHFELPVDSVYGMGFSVDFNKCGGGQLRIGHENVICGHFILDTMEACISVGDHVYVGGNTSIRSALEIRIGNDVMIGWNCMIYDHDVHSIYWEHRKEDVINVYNALKSGKRELENKDWDKIVKKKIIINDKVWIGHDVKILKGVIIGEGAVIATGSIVTKDVPAYTVVAGNPAVIVKQIN